MYKRVSRIKSLEKYLDDLSLRYMVDEPMSRHTTFRIGGPADYYVEVKNEQDFINLILFLIRNEIDYIVLGWGSNVLVSDEGIRGVVIRYRSNAITILDQINSPKQDRQKFSESENKGASRHIEAEEKKRKIYSFTDLDYDETDSDSILIEVGAGVDLPYLINWTIDRGFTGLQWFSGIPGTVGGAVYNNIHGGTHLLEEYFVKARVLRRTDGELIYMDRDDMKFDYDHSIIHKSNDVIVTATLRLYLGDKERAKATASEWYKRKSIQPRNTPGCVWKNITQEDKDRLGFETVATGYIIDQKLGWRGKKKIGGAYISEKHANFIENGGTAKAVDVLRIMKETKDAVREKFGLNLESEIVFLGFETKDLDSILASL